MAFQRKKFLTGKRIPHFARSVVASSNKAITRLIERAVCEWENVGSQDFEEVKALVLVGFDLFDELVN